MEHTICQEYYGQRMGEASRADSYVKDGEEQKDG